MLVGGGNPEVVRQDTVVDLRPTSRYRNGAPDTLAVAISMIVQGPEGELSVEISKTLAAFADEKGEYRATITVPEPDAVAPKGASFNVVVLLPRAGGRWNVELVSVEGPGEPQQNRVDGRTVLTWTFEQDPDISWVWRYV